MSALPSIDPRTVPVLAVDSDLPAVPAERLNASALRSRFATPPAWTPEVVREPKFLDRPPADAAVLVPLVQNPEGLSVLLTQRTAHLPTHAGQIAFPGGKVDAQDSSVKAAALREAHEEVGLHPRHVEVIGQLPIYTTGSGFHITPVVALVHTPFELQPNPGEVDAVWAWTLGLLGPWFAWHSTAEPVVRVMVEAADVEQAQAVADRLAAVVQAEQARQQLGDSERLGQIILGTGIQRRDLLRLLRAG